MTGIIAVFNAGSSTLKFAYFNRADLSLLHQGNVEVKGEAGHAAALKAALAWLDTQDGTLCAAGHRVVHGKDFTAPQRITPHILHELQALVPLAPLHQPHNLRIIEALVKSHPDVPQVACFDTAFHRTQPKLAEMFALPRNYYDTGIKRYGFHGISYEYIASVLPRHTQKARGKIIVAHLGNGASLCAMQDLKSVATSMGFSTLDGLMMGTRCGSLDAGVMLYMQQHLRMSADAVSDVLYHQSGLLGVSGISNDMRTLEQSAAPQAHEAVALFCRMAARQIGSLTAELGGLDALVFTGGIGEHSAQVRDAICGYFTWLGALEVHVIPTNEELVIARACAMPHGER